LDSVGYLGKAALYFAALGFSGGFLRDGLLDLLENS